MHEFEGHTCKEEREREKDDYYFQSMTRRIFDIYNLEEKENQIKDRRDCIYYNNMLFYLKKKKDSLVYCKLEQ
jgi:replicative superfamily II helicase